MTWRPGGRASQEIAWLLLRSRSFILLLGDTRLGMPRRCRTPEGPRPAGQASTRYELSCTGLSRCDRHAHRGKVTGLSRFVTDLSLVCHDVIGQLSTHYELSRTLAQKATGGQETADYQTQSGFQLLRHAGVERGRKSGAAAEPSDGAMHDTAAGCS